MIVLGLALAAGSAAAIGWSYALQHAVASTLPPIALRHPFRSLRMLVSRGRWTAGFLLGVGGWLLYVAALRLAPLSLAQAASAGGIAVLALGADRLRTSEKAGVAAALMGLVLLGLSLGPHTPSSHGTILAVALWIAVSSAVAGGAARIGSAPSLGAAAGVLYAAGDVATKAAVAGGIRLVFVPVLLACSGLAFVCLQLAFQRGSALTTAGLAVLWTNALPIAAGTALYGESLPGGSYGAARVSAFVFVLVGAVALARRGAAAPARASAEPAPTTAHSSGRPHSSRRGAGRALPTARG